MTCPLQMSWAGEWGGGVGMHCHVMCHLLHIVRGLWMSVFMCGIVKQLLVPHFCCTVTA